MTTKEMTKIEGRVRRCLSATAESVRTSTSRPAEGRVSEGGVPVKTPVFRWTRQQVGMYVAFDEDGRDVGYVFTRGPGIWAAAGRTGYEVFESLGAAKKAVKAMWLDHWRMRPDSRLAPRLSVTMDPHPTHEILEFEFDVGAKPHVCAAYRDTGIPEPFPGACDAFEARERHCLAECRIDNTHAARTLHHDGCNCPDCT